jgi:anaerobic selenocysteine-containing dehydrogenase
MDDKLRVQGKQFVLINEKDAAKRTIANGDKVIVFNDRGSYEGVAEITEDVNEGIIVSTLGYWRQHNKGTVNSISSGNLADMGNAPTFSDNLVEIKKI